MNCEQAGEMLSEWLDGRLDAAEYERLERHLDGCATCTGQRDALQPIDRLLASAPLAQAPRSLRARTMARLEQQGRTRHAVIGGLALTLGVATLALLFLAPLLPSLLGLQSLWHTISQGGPQTMDQLLTLGRTAGRAGLVSLRNMSVPLGLVSLFGFLFAVGLNGLWLGILYKLRTATCA